MSCRLLGLVFCAQALAVPMPQALVLPLPAETEAVVEYVFASAVDFGEDLTDESQEEADPSDEEDGRTTQAQLEDDIVHSPWDEPIQPALRHAFESHALPPEEPHLERPPRPPASLKA